MSLHGALAGGDSGVDDMKKNAKFQGQLGTEAKDAFGPWVLVT